MRRHRGHYDVSVMPEEKRSVYSGVQSTSSVFDSVALLFDATYMCGPHIAQVRIRIALRMFRLVVLLAIQAILPLRYKYMKNIECHP